MHDCPACRVPLHGWEEVCPSCGTKQYARRKFPFLAYKIEEPTVNLLPFAIAILCVALIIFSALPNSWIGRLLREGSQQQDPLEKMTYQEARQIIETKLTEGLSAVGAKGRLSWALAAEGKPVDKNVDQAIELTVDTSLRSPELRKGIVDPVKPYMDKAKITTLTMNDAKSGATWSYSVAPSLPLSEPDAELH